MLMSVIICDDDPKHNEYLKGVVSDFIALNDYPIKIALVATEPLGIINYLQKHPKQDNLYILDVDLRHKLNGVLLAKKIRELDSTGKIIFVTTHAKLSYLTFKHKVEAMDYIIKDTPQKVREQVYDCLETTYRFYLNKSIEGECFKVNSTMGLINVPINDILYFEASHRPHILTMHTTKSRIEFRGTLKEVVEQSEHFFMCNRSFVVNKNNIVRVTRVEHAGECEVKGGSILPISRSKIAPLKKMIA